MDDLGSRFSPDVFGAEINAAANPFTRAHASTLIDVEWAYFACARYERDERCS